MGGGAVSVDLDALEALDALLTRATPAPWSVRRVDALGPHPWFFVDAKVADAYGRFEVAHARHFLRASEDATAIAVLRNAAPALIAELRRLRAIEAAARALLKAPSCAFAGDCGATPCAECRAWQPLREALAAKEPT